MRSKCADIVKKQNWLIFVQFQDMAIILVFILFISQSLSVGSRVKPQWSVAPPGEYNNNKITRDATYFHI